MTQSPSNLHPANLTGVPNLHPVPRTNPAGQLSTLQPPKHLPLKRKQNTNGVVNLTHLAKIAQVFTNFVVKPMIANPKPVQDYTPNAITYTIGKTPVQLLILLNQHPKLPEFLPWIRIQLHVHSPCVHPLTICNTSLSTK